MTGERDGGSDDEGSRRSFRRGHLRGEVGLRRGRGGRRSGEVEPTAEAGGAVSSRDETEPGDVTKHRGISPMTETRLAAATGERRLRSLRAWGTPRNLPGRARCLGLRSSPPAFPLLSALRFPLACLIT